MILEEIHIIDNLYWTIFFRIVKSFDVGLRCLINSFENQWRMLFSLCSSCLLFLAVL